MPLVCFLLIFSYVTSYAAFSLRGRRPFAALWLPVLLSLSAWWALGADAGFLATFEAVLSRDHPADAVETELALEVGIGDWTASLETDFEADTWDEQSFEISWESGETEVTSLLRFEPSRSRLKDWKTDVAWTSGATDIEIEHKLTRTRNWLSIEVDWTSESVEIGARLRHRATGLGQPFQFYDAGAQAEFSICGIETAIGVKLDEAGFDEATLEFSDVVVDALPLLLFDLEAEWTIAGTDIEIAPSLEVGGGGCVELELEATCSDGFIHSLRLAEVEIEGEFGPIEIDGAFLFDADDWIDDTYEATVEVTAEIVATPGLDADLELSFFWEGDPSSGIRPARISSQLRLELSARLAMELGIDLLMRPLTLLGLSCRLE
ncbi:hypothetical protein ACFLTM_00505 [Candidatus Bipolaricaulota bacterium]